jgi:hypothetical protein
MPTTSYKVKTLTKAILDLKILIEEKKGVDIEINIEKYIENKLYKNKKLKKKKWNLHLDLNL